MRNIVFVINDKLEEEFRDTIMENIEAEKQECLAIPSKSNRIMVRKRKEKQGEH